MPVTTFLKHTPVHPDPKIRSLLDDLNTPLNPLWFAHRSLKKKRLFKEDEHSTTLYKSIDKHLTEFQVITCVTNDRELKCYLYGALNSC